MYRRLVSHPEWLAYVGKLGPFHLRGPQQAWVTLFSSQEDLNRAQDQSPEPIHTVSMAGFEPFALHLGGRAGVAIDPASPGGIHFKRPQLAHLEEWGRGAWVERLLRHQRSASWVAQQLVAHAPFWVLAEGQGSETRWVRAKVGGGRSGVALFALGDAPYRFIEAQGLDVSELRLLRFSGRELFSALTAEVNLSDVILNPAGPGPPVHIRGSLLEQWLAAAQ